MNKPYNGNTDYSYNGRRSRVLGTGMARKAAETMKDTKQRKRGRLRGIMDQIKGKY